MALLCCGVVAPTRYNATGLEGLTDRSRRPYRHANQLPIQIETLTGGIRSLAPKHYQQRRGMQT